MSVTLRPAMPSPPTTPTRPRRTLAWAMAGLAFVLGAVLSACLVGTATESLVARGDRERYPAPGRVVDTPHGSLHLHCTGRGSPTVLLEAGLGEPGLSWVEIQRELDRSVTVCSYDRAGYGWSPAAEGNWDAHGAAVQVTQALDATDHGGPYLVVAHSLGALVARELRQAKPEAVVGMVLLDPTNEVVLQRVGTPALAITERTAMLALARSGAVRLFGDRLIPSLVGSQPPRDLLSQAPAAYHSRAVVASLRELRGAPGAARQLLMREDTDWADLPVTVVSAANAPQQDREHHRAIAARSARGQHLVAGSGGHYVHYDNPDLVVAAVCDVLVKSAAPATC